MTLLCRGAQPVDSLPLSPFMGLALQLNLPVREEHTELALGFSTGAPCVT